MTTPTDPLYVSQWHFGMMGDIERIWDEFSGAGVHVGVYDDGIDLAHEDLAPNYDASRHVVDNTLTPIIPIHNPLDINAGHGTATAGLIGAARNDVGGVGVAWGVGLTSVNIFHSGLYGWVNALDKSGFFDVVHQAATRFDITSHSWGAAPGFFQSLTDGGFSQNLEQEYAYLSASGRGGLGTIVVQAAGNNNLDANGDGVNASRFTITVAATESTGFAAYYSNYGASILVAAPAAAVTTDISGDLGYQPIVADPANDGNYTTGFNGTSAATPVVSGVIALMLQANPNLGWRDVQDILAMSATLTGTAFNAIGGDVEEDGLWQANHADFWNGGGNHIHTNYGYGMVNAYNAVRMAEAWNLFGEAETSLNESLVTVVNDFTDVTLTDNDATGFNTTFTVAEDLSIDHVALHLDMASGWVGDLNITLTSAEGTVITVNKGHMNGQNTYTGDWVFGLDQLRGELSAGTWTLHVADIWVLETTTLRSAALDFYGSTPTTNTTYHITDEYLTMVGFEAGRGTITDNDGGADWLDLAAVQGNVSINMAYGQTFTVDSVNWATLSGTFENIVTGDGNDSIIGNDQENVIYGMRGDDLLRGGDNRTYGGAGDTLYGGTGNDTLDGGLNKDDSYGGDGNDLFVSVGGDFLDNVYGGADTDTLDLSAQAFIDFTVNLDTQNYQISPNVYGVNGTYDLVDVENVIGSNLNDSITGDTFANVLSGAEGSDTINGDAGADTLNGGDGTDTLNGGSAFDSMTGGNDSDWYFVDSASDVIVEGSTEGLQDRVLSGVSYTLAVSVFVEQLSTNLQSGVVAINLTGNEVAQSITGNTGVNVLTGNGDNDTLIGLGGTDTLNGGTGTDSMVGGDDSDWYFVDSATDLISETSTGGLADRVLSGVSYTLAGGVYVEQLTTNLQSGLTAINLTGNDVSQSITGNAGVNVLTGNGGNDTLLGLGGTDTLNGGTGTDSMVGGDDSDWYFVDSATDLISESSTGGLADRVLSSVSYTLAGGVYVEQLTTNLQSGLTAISLTGNEVSQSITGNAGVNVLTGNGGNDTLLGLAGTDTLNGGTGNDSMSGGDDSDWYFVDSATDLISESSTGGLADRVLSSVSYSLAGGVYVEQLTTNLQAGLTAINLTGNDFVQSITGNAGVNVLTGNGGNDTMIGLAGADTLNGGTGTDSMVGGDDSDWYFVDSATDVISETSTGGLADRVLSSVSYSLAGGVYIEQLTTNLQAGLTAINLTGNDVAQSITGNSGANALNGGGGNDTLIGLGGTDTFVFNTALGAGNVDSITGFSVVDDTIQIDDAVFAGLTAGALAASAFAANVTGVATDALQRIIYETDTGKLFFDGDGIGVAKTAVQFATVSTGLAMTFADFFVI